MNFGSISKLASIISRPFAEDFFRLLAIYDSISASEAASMLDIHIKTAQDFLEGLAEADVLSKEEVSEGKRPYFRYKLEKHSLELRIDFREMRKATAPEDLDDMIREKRGNGAIFTEGSGPEYISSISLFTGEGRGRKERKINLTGKQGRFIYFLPFPNAQPRSIRKLLKESGLERKDLPELLDLIKLLVSYSVVEITRDKAQIAGR